MENLIEGWGEDDGRFDPCENIFLFDVEILSEWMGLYLAWKQKKKSVDFYFLAGTSSYALFPSREVNRFMLRLTNDLTNIIYINIDPS